jgi:hypothetical protein
MVESSKAPPRCGNSRGQAPEDQLRRAAQATPLRSRRVARWCLDQEEGDMSKQGAEADYSLDEFNGCREVVAKGGFR